MAITCTLMYRLYHYSSFIRHGININKSYIFYSYHLSLVLHMYKFKNLSRTKKVQIDTLEWKITNYLRKNVTVYFGVISPHSCRIQM